jgi:ABC-2 type transport system permease protein
MFLCAGVVLPLLGLDAWAWHPPATVGQALLFALSMALVVTLATAVTMLINISVVVTLNDRGINSLVAPFTIVLSGNLIPLPLFPDWMRTALFVQPFAGLIDIPFRIYSGNLHGLMAAAGIGLQMFWTIVFVLLGRVWMERVMRHLEMQGG